MTELLTAGVHFGHQVRKWHPKMSAYIFTARDGVHVIDLAKTVEKLAEAAEYVEDLAKSGGVVVFVGTKRQAQKIVAEAASNAGANWVINRWIGGLITNFDEVYKNIVRLNDLIDKRDKGEFGDLTKKEQLLINREIARLENLYGGLKSLKGLPDAIFVVDARRDETAIKEAARRDVKVIAICDTNANPELVDYPIPGNDDAVKSIKILVETMVAAFGEGRKVWEKEHPAVEETKPVGVVVERSESPL